MSDCSRAGASWSWPGGFRDMGGGAQAGADVCKPAADPARGQGAVVRGPGFPGAAQVGRQGAGEQQLGERGHDQADPPVGLGGGADLGGGQAEGALGEFEGVFAMRKSALRTLCGRAGNAAWRANSLAMGGDRAGVVRIIACG